MYDSGTAAALAARDGLVAGRLVWITARKRSTGLLETIGIWSGEDDLTLEVGGQPRPYTGAGALMRSDPITAGTGLAVRTYQIGLAAVAPEVEALVKGYETRLAPLEIHRALFNPATRALAGPPHRVFSGFINGIDFPTAEPGGTASCTLELISETRALTRTLASKKSDESQQRRGGDRFRRYGNISGVVPVYWGELRIAAPADPAPVTVKPEKTGNA
ncbi:hypothetical protein ETW23_03910 [Leisingera sp. NJS201]|nr:hypothetical protein ETW23_03910 [Leisingera sp. NJS201]